MWSGSLTLGDFWSAYIGQSDQNSPHAHVALQLAVGLDGDVTVHVGHRRMRAHGVLIRPLVTHTVAPGCGVAMVYLEPQAALGRALLELMADAPAMVLPERFVMPSAQLIDPKALVERLTVELDVGQQKPLDARLRRALELLERRAPGPGLVHDAARQAGISSSRLRALATGTLGTPLARWLLWRKLERAARALAAGESLAAAAAAGGFSDQAHFARTMRRMFGVTPSVAAKVLR